MFTLHVASLGVSNYVGRRAGLFLKRSTLTLCEMGESTEGNALLLALWHTCQWEHSCWFAAQIGGFSRLVWRQRLGWGLIPRGYSVCRFALNGVRLLQVRLVQASTPPCTAGILFGSKPLFLKNKTNQKTNVCKHVC